MSHSVPASASERRAAARTAVVWEALHDLLGDGARQVLDIGGGTGVSAVRMAELGHQVTVVDPSPDALAALGRRADESGLTDRIVSQQGDVTELPSLVAPASFDVVLCHGVLEVVDDPAAALAAIAGVLRPGGAISLLVAQRHAAVIARAMAGHFQQARGLLEGSAAPGRGGRRFDRAEVVRLLEEAGYVVELVHGVRVFADLVPGALLDLEPGATQALVELERAVADLSDYHPLATQLHLLARR